MLSCNIISYLDKEKWAQHAEGKANEELWQDEELPPAKLIHHEDRDGGACDLDHAHHNGADVGIKLGSLWGIVLCWDKFYLASGILKYLHYVGVDDFDSRKLL